MTKEYQARLVHTLHASAKTVSSLSPSSTPTVMKFNRWASLVANIKSTIQDEELKSWLLDQAGYLKEKDQLYATYLLSLAGKKL